MNSKQKDGTGSDFRRDLSGAAAADSRHGQRDDCFAECHAAALHRLFVPQCVAKRLSMACALDGRRVVSGFDSAVLQRNRAALYRCVFSFRMFGASVGCGAAPSIKRL